MASPSSDSGCTKQAPKGPAADVSAAGKTSVASPGKTYQDVSVLLVNWKNGSKWFKRDIWLLDTVFRGRLNYSTMRVELPSDQPKRVLAHSVEQLLSHGRPSNLLIIAYSGHGGRSAKKDGAKHDLLWYESSESESSYLNWSTLQESLLPRAESDVLIILDCCHAVCLHSKAAMNLSGVKMELGAVDCRQTSEAKWPYSFLFWVWVELEIQHFWEPGTAATTSDLLGALVDRVGNREDDAYGTDTYLESFPRRRHLSTNGDPEIRLHPLPGPLDNGKTHWRATVEADSALQKAAMEAFDGYGQICSDMLVEIYDRTRHGQWEILSKKRKRPGEDEPEDEPEDENTDVKPTPTALNDAGDGSSVATDPGASPSNRDAKSSSPCPTVATDPGA